MPFVNGIAVVCMREGCRVYGLPGLRTFDPAVDLHGNRVRCSKCGFFTGIMVVSNPRFYQDLSAQPFQGELLDVEGDEGDGSGYNLLPIDVPQYPLRHIPRFEARPRTTANPAGGGPVTPSTPAVPPTPRATVIDASRLAPFSPADFFGMTTTYGRSPLTPTPTIAHGALRSAPTVPTEPRDPGPAQGMLARPLTPDEGSEQCTICCDADEAEHPADDKRATICAVRPPHVFHRACLAEWQRTGRTHGRNCPVCRRLLVQ